MKRIPVYFLYMTKSAKFVIILVACIGFLAIASTFYKYYISHDYLIQTEVDCNPKEESCFIYICDEDTEECTGNAEEDTWYYKLLHRKAFNTPLCDPNSEECTALTCEEKEEDCYEELCVESDEEGCTNPSDFVSKTEEDELDTVKTEENLESELEEILEEEPSEQIDSEL